MTLDRKAGLFALCGLLVAASATASVPSPGNSTAPGFILMVGAAAGVPDTLDGVFTVIVRDLANNPINGSSVVIDLSGCDDLRICTNQLNVNYTVDCATKTIRAFTNFTGAVRFTILGASKAGLLGPFDAHRSSRASCGKIFADGVLIKSPTIAALDLDGVGGAGANDLSWWINDFGTGEYWGRSDFDGSGGSTVGANDLSTWIACFPRNPLPGCSTYCLP